MRKNIIILSLALGAVLSSSHSVNATEHKNYKTYYTKKEVTMYSKVSDDGRLFKKKLIISKGKKIKVIKRTKKVTMIKYDNHIGFCKSQYITTKKKKNYIYKNTPKNSFKSFMSYKTITDTSSKQYALQQKAYTGNYGIRMVGDRYCVALGSYYTTKIGTKFDLIMENGSVIKCILADVKADIHTDATNRITVANGCISEFVVDMSALNRNVLRDGTISSCNKQFRGRIKKIKIYKK